MSEATAKSAIPVAALAGFYFFYFALLGALYTYWADYLQQAGYSIQQIGTLIASLMATKIVAPNIWGWLADRSGQRLRILRWGAFLTLVIFSLALWEPGFWGLLAVMVGFSFFWNAILPQQEVITLHHLSDERHRYSQIRSAGSIGFILITAGLGLFFDYYPLAWLPWILILLMAAIWASTWLLWEAKTHVNQEATSNSFLQQLLKPQVMLFFILCLLMQLSHGPYYSFFLIYLQGYGFSKFTVGLLIALGVVAEIGVFFSMRWFMARLSINRMVQLCFLLAALRWWLIAEFPELLTVLILAQLTHAATYGMYHAVCIQRVSEYFSPQCAGQAQAFYSAFSFGVGGALGAYFSGLIWASLGAETAYLAAAIVAAIALIMCSWQRTG